MAQAHRFQGLAGHLLGRLPFSRAASSAPVHRWKGGGLFRHFRHPRLLRGCRQGLSRFLEACCRRDSELASLWDAQVSSALFLFIIHTGRPDII